MIFHVFFFFFIQLTTLFHAVGDHHFKYHSILSTGIFTPHKSRVEYRQCGFRWQSTAAFAYTMRPVGACAGFHDFQNCGRP
jgi:hypothetical protein